jgi:hypothetical protein
MRKSFTTQNPPISGNALKAWNWMAKKNTWEVGKPPRILVQKNDGDADIWVGTWCSDIQTMSVLDVLLCTLNEDGSNNMKLIKEIQEYVAKQKAKNEIS